MDLSASIVLDRPAAEVFDYVVDVSHDSEWRTRGCEGRIHIGSTARRGSGSRRKLMKNRIGTC